MDRGAGAESARAESARPARTRREEYSDTTRAALVSSAANLFAERGYAATSLDEVVADARVTKGALYHHFGSKQALFGAVFDELEMAAIQRIKAAAASASDPWDAALAALREYLALNAEPRHGRLVVQEGPVALGWGAWHAEEERYGLGVTRGLLQHLIDRGRVTPVPVETTSRIIFGMLLAAAHWIVAADDKEAAVQETEAVITRFLESLLVSPDVGGS